MASEHRAKRFAEMHSESKINNRLQQKKLLLDLSQMFFHHH